MYLQSNTRMYNLYNFANSNFQLIQQLHTSGHMRMKFNLLVT